MSPKAGQTERSLSVQPLSVGPSVSRWIALVLAVPLLSWWTLSCGRSDKNVSSPASVEKGPQLLELSGPQMMGGPEVCFNGVDDNKNSLIDEGCGVAQSEVQFVLAWDSEDADLDLYVRDPEGGLAVTGGTTTLGLTLSADCPKQEKGCRGQNYENVYVEDAEIAAGVYHVRVRLEKAPVRRSSVKARLGVRLPSRTTSYEIEMFDEGQEIVAEFEVHELVKKASLSSDQSER